MPLDTTPTDFETCAPRFEKSPDLLYYQLKLVECRRSGDRRNAPWFLRCAASYRERDMAVDDRHEPDWGHSVPRQRSING